MSKQPRLKKNMNVRAGGRTWKVKEITSDGMVRLARIYTSREGRAYRGKAPHYTQAFKMENVFRYRRVEGK